MKMRFVSKCHDIGDNEQLIDDENRYGKKTKILQKCYKNVFS